MITDTLRPTTFPFYRHQSCPLPHLESVEVHVEILVVIVDAGLVGEEPDVAAGSGCVMREARLRGSSSFKRIANHLPVVINRGVSNRFKNIVAVAIQSFVTVPAVYMVACVQNVPILDDLTECIDMILGFGLVGPLPFPVVWMGKVTENCSRCSENSRSTL